VNQVSSAFDSHKKGEHTYIQKCLDRVQSRSDILRAVILTLSCALIKACARCVDLHVMLSVRLMPVLAKGVPSTLGGRVP